MESKDVVKVFDIPVRSTRIPFRDAGTGVL